ncbi:4-amino-4-deoxy-L-arabinose-phosphoundecaprenol flippase subunit ArnE [Proteus myxofaciens]|uniref:Probable 4-amino-4-deoxy-L-arabinose-phosphoundecaprenol flippase subunit ArnE n=1 Tax=Proteus myxofaciens ATCC 19692 TaxID=1354337 RepID=A0A198FB67_9GAMM|nr:4-amino-4-deoxy-L-arabinose-phosphoundecaprenol flippase subunit ArnE [Proteus myxofaciens]OAT21634.1 polymyxin resistance sucrose-6 phosphate hydrolase [Proteus myxofaciens ATCC 19692]
MSFVLLLIVSLLTCIGQVCQKQAVVSWQSGVATKARKTIFWLITAIAMLGFGMLFWLRLLQILPLSIAYPMLSVNFIVVTLIGQFLYKEPVNSKHWIGIGSIMLGIFLMSMQS